jgi:hypothetical protein
LPPSRTCLRLLLLMLTLLQLLLLQLHLLLQQQVHLLLQQVLRRLRVCRLLLQPFDHGINLAL